MAKLSRSSSSYRKQSANLRKTPCSSAATTRGTFGTSRGSSGTSRQSPLPPTAALKSPEKRLPLVTNDLVLAQGSHRALVLTQGGSRCNDYQLEIERRIINKHDLDKHCPHLGQVT